MPLTLTGEQIETIEGVSLRTQNQHGEYVIVLATHGATQDHGLHHVERVASSKYDAGKVETNGTVTVRTLDFI